MSVTKYEASYDALSTWIAYKAGSNVVPATVSMVCVIKGNISAKGERIYRLPGTIAYTRTVIAEKAGERMFCNEKEAKVAGWRAPRG